MNIFPAIPNAGSAGPKPLPLCREVEWNYAENRPIFEGGEPKLVSGLYAVKVWAYKALRTPRFRYEIYSWSFGCELERLIGRGTGEEVKKAEAARYVRECLCQSPYIKSVSEIGVSILEDAISVSCLVDTVYGTLTIGGESIV